MTAKTLPGFDFRRMCLAGIRAAESAHGAGRTVTQCPTTGAQLSCDGFGIWSVSEPTRILGYPVQTDPTIPYDELRLVDGEKIVARITNFGASCPSAD